MAVHIRDVVPGSPAARKGIRPGDRLLSLNGHEIMDVLDYRFYLDEPHLTAAVDSPEGKRVVRLHRDGDGETGLLFETYLMDKQHSCRNKCVFCFIDQMPPGLRESLYFKDDDSRLSFLFGNYITLTNLSEHEISRILDMHISPMHVSVHTTNPELRCRMMNNRFAGETLGLLRRFADAGIRLECQLVLCPGLNDGGELIRSMTDLAALGDAVESVAAVPVGLTKYRDGLEPLRSFTKEEAAAVLDAMEDFGDRMLAERGNRVFYPADEFYLKAGRPVPDFYGEMAQLENGVGLTALLFQQFREALADCGDEAKGSPMTIATGVAAAPLLRMLIDEAGKKWDNLHVDVIAVRNDFFGEKITVAGLVTGGDLIRQLRGRTAPVLLIPDAMLRHEGDRFLDDVLPGDVERELGVELRVTPVDGAALLREILR